MGATKAYFYWRYKEAGIPAHQLITDIGGWLFPWVFNFSKHSSRNRVASCNFRNKRRPQEHMQITAVGSEYEHSERKGEGNRKKRHNSILQVLLFLLVPKEETDSTICKVCMSMCVCVCSWFMCYSPTLYKIRVQHEVSPTVITLLRPPTRSTCLHFL